MRYNPKSWGMLNRDMLKRDLFFFLGIIILLDIYVLVKFDGSEPMRTSRLLAIIFTVVIVVAIVLFILITKPKRIIPDALIDAAEEFELVVPQDATKRIVTDLFPALSKGKVYTCCRDDAGFGTVCEALRSLQGARTTIEPDYPRLNITVHTADSSELLETFQENVTFGGTIYRVRQKELDASFFNEAFTVLFKEKSEA